MLGIAHQSDGPVLSLGRLSMGTDQCAVVVFSESWVEVARGRGRGPGRTRESTMRHADTRRSGSFSVELIHGTLGDDCFDRNVG